MAILDRIKKHMPDQAWLEKHPMLKRFGGRLRHPSLWTWSRHEVALGASVGVFFGLLIPIAQIPLSALAAIILRANLAVAAASTLVTNPITFAPIYYAAYHLGSVLLGTVEDQAVIDQLDHIGTTDVMSPGILERIADIGQPMIVGLSISAVTFSLACYLAINLIWLMGCRFRKQGNHP